MIEAITTVVCICKTCNVNQVEPENLQEETCSSCISEYDEDGSGTPRELNFDEPEGRKDDRINPEPTYSWLDEEIDSEF